MHGYVQEEGCSYNILGEMRPPPAQDCHEACISLAWLSGSAAAGGLGLLGGLLTRTLPSPTLILQGQLQRFEADRQAQVPQMRHLLEATVSAMQLPGPLPK